MCKNIPIAELQKIENAAEKEQQSMMTEQDWMLCWHLFYYGERAKCTSKKKGRQWRIVKRKSETMWYCADWNKITKGDTESWEVISYNGIFFLKVQKLWLQINKNQSINQKCHAHILLNGLQAPSAPSLLVKVIFITLSTQVDTAHWLWGSRCTHKHREILWDHSVVQ